jgi:hypothetical protein
MAQVITLEQVRTACAPTLFDLGNDCLYRLCKEHPGHRREDEIMAKLILIGRTYAASIERRKLEDGDELRGDQFLFKQAIPEIQRNEKQIDEWIADAKRNPIPEVCIGVHAKLTELFFTISNMKNRSLASKYLHFHCPDHFYIYDSRAWISIKGMFPGKWSLPVPAKTDDAAYAKFYRMCCSVVADINQRHGIRLNPRQLDNLLLKQPAIS